MAAAIARCSFFSIGRLTLTVIAIGQEAVRGLQPAATDVLPRSALLGVDFTRAYVQR